MERGADDSLQDRYYTVKEAAEHYFQGKVSAREVYSLFARGELRGFRVGAGHGRILIYGTSLETYRRNHENGTISDQPEPIPRPGRAATETRKRRAGLPLIRLNRIPE